MSIVPRFGDFFPTIVVVRWPVVPITALTWDVVHYSAMV